jgi:hypothetical protein
MTPPLRGYAIPLAAVALGLAGALAGCGDSNDIDKSGPSGILRVTRLVPNVGPTDSTVAVRIEGDGFANGATVTVGGSPVAATVVGSTSINATLSPHEAGRVDVVVTNPGGAAATLPSGYQYVLLAATSVSPTGGYAGTVVTILGAGFVPGTTVTMGGLAAPVRGVTNGIIGVQAPVLSAAGPVDIVVTNPGGATAMLANGFTYDVITLTAAPASVTAGGQLTITWSGSGRGFDDWIGLFKVGDANENYGWWEYVPGNGTRSLTAPAPLVPGTYEFRYLPNDGFTDVARSNPVTVAAQPGRIR